MLTQPKYKSMYGSNSHRYQGAKLWNEVDNNKFKIAGNYDTWYKECSCSVIYAYSKFCDILW